MKRPYSILMLAAATLGFAATAANPPLPTVNAKQVSVPGPTPAIKLGGTSSIGLTIGASPTPSSTPVLYGPTPTISVSPRPTPTPSSTPVLYGPTPTVSVSPTLTPTPSSTPVLYGPTPTVSVSPTPTPTPSPTICDYMSDVGDIVDRDERCRDTQGADTRGGPIEEADGPAAFSDFSSDLMKPEFVSSPHYETLSEEEFVPDALKSSQIIIDYAYHNALFADPTFGLGIKKKSLWKNGILPYQLDSSFTDKETAVINKAIAIWNGQIGNYIRLSPKIAQKDFLYVSKDSDDFECSAYIGRQGGQQSMRLGKKCLQSNVSIDQASAAVPLHEFGHAALFGHEQQRPDRDDSVKVVDSDFIAPRYKGAFQILSDFIPQGAFDYVSLMIYGTYYGCVMKAGHENDPRNGDTCVSPVMVKYQKPYKKGDDTFEIFPGDKLSSGDLNAIKINYDQKKALYVIPATTAFKTGTRAYASARCNEEQYDLPSLSLLREYRSDLDKLRNGKEACFWSATVNSRVKNSKRYYVYQLTNDPKQPEKIFREEDSATCSIVCARPNFGVGTTTKPPVVTLEFLPAAPTNGQDVTVTVHIDGAPDQAITEIALQGYLDGKTQEVRIPVPTDNLADNNTVSLRTGAIDIVKANQTNYVYKAYVSTTFTSPDGQTQTFQSMGSNQFHIDPPKLPPPTCTATVTTNPLKVMEVSYLSQTLYRYAELGIVLPSPPGKALGTYTARGFTVKVDVTIPSDGAGQTFEKLIVADQELENGPSSFLAKTLTSLDGTSAKVDVNSAGPKFGDVSSTAVVRKKTTIAISVTTRRNDIPSETLSGSCDLDLPIELVKDKPAK